MSYIPQTTFAPGYRMTPPDYRPPGRPADAHYNIRSANSERVLKWIAEHPGKSNVAIARGVHITNDALARRLQHMVAVGAVEAKWGYDPTASRPTRSVRLYYPVSKQ